jgi:membrane protein implicated in regulation of membrane protease activity
MTAAAEDGARQRNGLGTAAVVTGALSVVTFWVPLPYVYLAVSLPLGVAAVVLGRLGRRRVRAGEAGNPGAARAGLVLGVLGVVLCLADLVTAYVFLTSYGRS